MPPGFILASQVTGRLAGNIREMRLMAFGFALALAGGLGLLAAILAGAGIVFVCIALFVAISSIGIINPTCLSLAMQAQRKNAGSASALLGLFQFVLGGVVAPAVGLAGTGTALPMAGILLLCQAGALASFFFLVYMAKSGTNPPHHAESSANG